MRTRLASLCVLGVGVAAACDTESTGPVTLDRPSFQVNFQEETHFRCYIVSKQTPDTAVTVELDDQFIVDDIVTVDEPLQFCAPTSKNEEEVLKPEEHLTMYVAEEELPTHLVVETTDQFGPRTLEAVGSRTLLVPTEKLVNGVSLGIPTELNHSRCYEVTGAPVGESVALDDQFGAENVRVEKPHYFCNPVEKTQLDGDISEILEPEVHLTCYEIFGPQRAAPQTFGINNQIESDDFTVTAFQLLCVPSEKGTVTPLPPPSS
jgi:hypothetical protein